MDAIFVSIAAYRDPQLIPTVQDCLAKAAHPERLRFGICWQHGPEEQALPWAGDARFRILDVNWQASRGACWARAEIMKLHAGERYFMQIDSHHRFAEQWDERAIDQMALADSPKPILTTYATPFDPETPNDRQSLPMQMNFDRFNEEGIPLFRPAELVNWQTRKKPARARFVSGHFFFTSGGFVRDVPYDPELYFLGEEITIAVRAFTHGYDLFHPIAMIVWHEYTREYREHKHWTDHLPGNGVEVAWHERDRVSLDKVRRFIESRQEGSFGLGRVRSIADYEAYAGLDFRRRRVQEYTRRGEEPPNPPAPADWADRIKSYSLDVTIEKSRLLANADDYRLWYCGVHDDTGLEISRKDMDRHEVRTAMAAAAPYVTVHREFETDRNPASWTVWPLSESGVWLDRIDGPFSSYKPVTLVTALMDIGRDALSGPFGRSFAAHYLVLLERLLKINQPMVVCVEPAHEPLVWRHRNPCDTKVIPVRLSDLEAAPWYARVQEIRTRADWLAQASWLAKSPQAALPHYNPLVLSKMRWLENLARVNPFHTSTVFWIDVGLLNTVPEALIAAPTFGWRLSEATDEFLWVEYPHHTGSAFNGFPPAALAERAGVNRVDHGVKGSFFGGRTERVPEVAQLYDRELTETLQSGLMGTEESLFTILAHRYPEKFVRYLIESDGLMTPFFDALVRGCVRERRHGQADIASWDQH